MQYEGYSGKEILVVAHLPRSRQRPTDEFRDCILEGILRNCDYAGSPETPIPLDRAQREQYRAPLARTHRVRWHAQHTPMRSHIFHSGRPRDRGYTKKGSHGRPRGRTAAPRTRAASPCRWRFPQPAKAQRARAPAQLKGNAHAHQRERGAAGCKDQPSGRSLRCRAEPPAAHAAGSNASTRVGQRRPSYTMVPVAAVLCAARGRLHTAAAQDHDGRRQLGGRACIHARRRSRRAVSRERRRTRSRRSTCPRLTPRLRGHAQ